MRLPRPVGESIRLPTCPYCGIALIQSHDSAEPAAMVFHIVRICQHMIECHQGLHIGKDEL